MADFEPMTDEAGKRLFEPARSRDWPSADELKIIKKAVIAEEEFVSFGGIKYHITYGFRRNYPVSKETVDSIRLNRVDDFVPMAYIPVKKIMSA